MKVSPSFDVVESFCGGVVPDRIPLVVLEPLVRFGFVRIPNIPNPGPGMGAAVFDDRELSPNIFILLARAGLGPGLRKGVVVLDNAAVDVDVDPIR